jgi:hypothetical protein
MAGSENKRIKPKRKVDRSVMITMASKCRCILLFFAPVFLVSVSLAVDLKEACSTTPYPEVCVAVLSTNPESKAAADARGLALIAIRTAGKMAVDASTAVDVELRANPGVIDTTTMKNNNPTNECFLGCKGPIQSARENLYSKVGKDDNTTLATARYFFQADPTGAWNLGNCDRCHINGAPKLPSIITKDGDFNRFTKVTWKLVMQVPDVLIPPPPPNEFLNGTS